MEITGVPLQVYMYCGILFIKDKRSDFVKEKGLHADHRERMRERFRKNGISVFEDHEILEVLLFSVIPRRNTNDIAHALLNRFGSLAGVLSANKRELCEISGIGESSAEYLLYLGETFSEVTSQLFGHIVLDTEDRIGLYAVMRMGVAPAESALALYLDDNGIKIAEEWLYRGKSKMTDSLERYIPVAAKKNSATSVILIHNHKNEPLKKSPEDTVITENLRKNAGSAGIKKVWHVIVSDDGYLHI